MFKRLNYPICNRILKSKLPLRVRLFNNIECKGYGVTLDNQIEIQFTFNNILEQRYYIELGLQEMKEYIKKIKNYKGCELMTNYEKIKHYTIEEMAEDRIQTFQGCAEQE